MVQFKIRSALLTGLSMMAVVTPAFAQADMSQRPVLVITNKPMAATNTSPIYSKPVRAPDITPQQVMGEPYYDQTSTVVGKRIDGLHNDLFALEGTVNRLSEQLSNLQTRDQTMAAEYYASIATINTQLQTGTTPGNPRLIAKLDTAQSNLDKMSSSVANLNALAIEIAESASRASYLLDTTRATYNLSGAIEEDHVRLAQLEDKVNSSVVSIDRLLNSVNDDIARSSSYLATERNNLRTLALGVTDGNLYGKSLANYPFSRAGESNLLQQASYGGSIGGQEDTSSPDSAVRPLAKIRFDKANVDYQQPIYNAVQNALKRFPDSRFELLAVHPTAGNAAQVAIESTRARRNAEEVLRNLTQMGVSLDRIDLATAPSEEATSSEVHIFVK